ncbi:Putrescine-binding periplasmic protein [Beijerinckiaceae bacterium RH AL1]|nr:extracellular solute-binding protein [Beijerinckiaceae bacterium]VVB43326.1 Putrescine-binding periplasmic protein [Beijerinckiaceae bacterium RH AL8]VVB43341.1 Putrescine-binding periplasmic protein [Beijerinckiaceae bacterium RH CH11]VVC53784.1 Putrescine-binding periplasmic protein [Beijerinckiaceae bacterium RH AL1]
MPGLLALALIATAAPARAGGDLFIYNWTDYTAPALIEKFQKETGIKVTVDTYDSNETLLAKLKAGGANYDIVVISSDFVPIFIAEKLIQKIDGPKLDGFQNIEARWRGPAWDKGNDYTVPFDWGVTSFDVNTKYVKVPVDSLKTLFEPPPEAKGRVGMLSAPTEVMSQAELYLGLPPCQTDTANMKKVSSLLEAQSGAVKVYASDGAIEREASGETWIIQIWNGDAARARLANPDIRFVFPKEGVVGWMDNMAIPTSAKNPENARRFMAFLLRPENAALSENFTHYSSAITGVGPFLDPALRDAPELNVPKDTKIVFSPTCPAPAIKLIDRVWTKLRR